MRKLTVLLTIATTVVLLVGLTPSANATFTISDVTYTTNSLTFTIDGDMTGYVTPSPYEMQFSIRMTGDIFNGPADASIQNSWSASPFDNETLLYGGCCLYSTINTVPFICSQYGLLPNTPGNLDDAVATNNTVTVSWSEDYLNENASDTTLEFVWGNGHDRRSRTLLATYDATPPVPSVPLFTCIGFEPPMDKPVSVKKKNRVLPLKMVLVDENGIEITDMDIVAPPVVEVDFTGGDPTDPPGEDFLPAGQGDEGNQFVYTDDGKWQFNLQTKNFSGAGTYTITVVSGDPAEYDIESCEATFMIFP